MKRFLILAVATAAAATTLTAQAVVLNASFSGTVTARQGAGVPALGTNIAGTFSYDTLTAKYLSFAVGSFADASGYASVANITPDQYTALSPAQVSAVPTGTTTSSFKVDLEGLAKWSGFDAAALLTNSSQLPSNIDTAASTFGFYTGNADGTNIKSLEASLGGFTVAVVPEPASGVLMLLGVIALGRMVQRRQG